MVHGIRRVAMLSLHTSPLQQPGSGDAGGMNVYVRSLADALAERGIDVEVFTRAESDDQPETEHVSDGVLVRHVKAGPGPLAKEELPRHVSSLAGAMKRIKTLLSDGHFDAIHSHYWVSGMAGLLMTNHWDTPLIHSMHTMAKVKNQHLGPSDRAEPPARLAGEQRIVDQAERLIANTQAEARELQNLYRADPERVDVIAPGVDLSVFQPAFRAASRQRLTIGDDAFHVLFAGRIQRHKGPQVLLKAAAELKRRRPQLPLQITIVGAASGSEALELEPLVTDLGLDDVVTLHAPVEPVSLAHWYRSSDVVAMPSFSESFGLVALEAQACGTPVVATDVGGLGKAVCDGRTGLLVGGHSPADWASALEKLYDDPATRQDLGRTAALYAQGFGWHRTAELTANSYQRAVESRTNEQRRAAGRAVH